MTEKIEKSQVHILLHDAHSALWKIRYRIKFAIIEAQADDNDKAIQSLRNALENVNILQELVKALRSIITQKEDEGEYSD